MAEQRIESIIATTSDSAERWLARRDQLLVQLKLCCDLTRDYQLDKKSLQAALEYRRLLMRILSLYPPY
jgi:hypothetical protein